MITTTQTRAATHLVTVHPGLFTPGQAERIAHQWATGRAQRWTDDADELALYVAQMLTTPTPVDLDSLVSVGNAYADERDNA